MIRRELNCSIRFVGEDLSPAQEANNDQPFTVLDFLTSPSAEVPLEHLPMYVVLLADKRTVVHAFPEEVEAMYDKRQRRSA